MKRYFFIITIGSLLVFTAAFAKDYPYSTDPQTPCAVQGDQRAVLKDGKEWCVPPGSYANSSGGACRESFVPVVVIPATFGQTDTWCIPDSTTQQSGNIKQVQCPSQSNPKYDDKGNVLYCLKSIPASDTTCPTSDRVYVQGTLEGCKVAPLSITREGGTQTPIQVNEYKATYAIPCAPIFGGSCPDQNSASQGLPNFVVRLYQFGLMTAGLLAFSMIIYAGFIRIFSRGNPSKIADSNDQITQAIIGLLILFGAYLILNTINPNLVSLRNPETAQIDTNKIIQDSQQSVFAPDSGSQQNITDTQVEQINGCKLAAGAQIGIQTNISINGLTPQNVTASRCLQCFPDFVKNSDGKCECKAGFEPNDKGTACLPKTVLQPGPLDINTQSAF